MALLKPECKLAMANEALRYREMLDAITKVDRGVVVTLPDNIIPNRAKNIILKTMDEESASQEMINALQKSEDPQKIDVFTAEVHSKGQSIIAQKIRQIFKKALKTHSNVTCEECQMPDIPMESPPVQETMAPPLAKEISKISHQVPAAFDASKESPKSAQGNDTENSPFISVSVKNCDFNDSRIQELLHDDENVYSISSSQRGRAIIISNETFIQPAEGEKMKDREGTQYDLVNLCELFKQLQFETKVHNNLTKQQMMDVLDSERNQADLYNLNAFIVCILSHGAQGKVYGVDAGVLSIEDDICHLFDGKMCPALAGKPKIFILQACQGKEATRGIPVADADNDDELAKAINELEIGEKEDAESKFLHEKADMLVAYSTVGGYKSWRHPELGSWFVREIVNVFAARAHGEHIADMLTKVRRKVLAKNTGAATGGLYVQVTKTDTTLSKDFYFFPGYRPTP